MSYLESSYAAVRPAGPAPMMITCSSGFIVYFLDSVRRLSPISFVHDLFAETLLCASPEIGGRSRGPCYFNPRFIAIRRRRLQEGSSGAVQSCPTMSDS